MNRKTQERLKAELFGRKLNVPDMLREGFERGGDKTFVIYQHADGSRESCSYASLRAEAEELCSRLAATGLKKGDRLAVISSLRPWWYSVYFAAVLGGYRMVCIDPAVPVPQIHSMLRETSARAVFTTLPDFRLPRLLEGRIPVWAVESGFPSLNGCEQVDLLLEDAPELPEDAFFILFSSGTTGERRKGVLLGHHSIADAIEWNMADDAGIYKNRSAYSVRERDFMLFPPYHIAGLLCATFDLYCNTEIIMLERLTPHALASVLQELKPDNVCTVPGMLTILMKKIRAGLGGGFKKWFVSSLLGISGFLRRRLGINCGFGLLRFLNKRALGGNMRGFMIGASPCDGETMAFFLNMGIDVALAYGLTELGAPLAVTGPGYYLNSTGRVPHHAPGMDIRVINPDEKGRGEVEILSPFRMISYLHEEDMEGCFTDDGYFRSGDLGYFNDENCLVLCGRAKEAIVLRSGEKLLPEEIESRYQGIEGLGELAAFRVSGEGGCDSFSIAAVKDKSVGWPDEMLRVHILDRAAKLPAAFVPQEVYLLKELPLSSSHKVQRFRLTEMAEQGLTAPVSDASLRTVTEDGPAGELRALLIRIGGPQWKSVELTEGLPLNLDSLQSMELFVAVQDTFGVDLFQLAEPPETFGKLLESVTAFEESDKREAPSLDLRQYPEPVKDMERFVFGSLERFVKLLWNVHGRGMENLPKDTNYLICANHVTVLDPAWISVFLPDKARKKTAIVGKSTLVDSKTLRDFVRSRNLIPVDRNGNTLPTLDRCRELLEEGWNVEIFPEGTNQGTGDTFLSFKEGAARLSIATGRPIVPVRIRGVKDFDRDVERFLPPTGGRVEVIFGEPIYPGDHTPEELTQLLRDTVIALAPVKTAEAEKEEITV